MKTWTMFACLGALSAAIVLPVLGCDNEGERPVASEELVVVVSDGQGAPVVGAEVRGPMDVARGTDRRGRARFVFTPKPGVSVFDLVEVSCPEGHRLKREPAEEVVLTRIKSLGGAAIPFEARFACEPTTRAHVLVVRADGEGGIPVIVGGERVGETDKDGVAQVRVSGAPGREIRVVLDTALRPELRPASPSRLMRLPPRSRFLVFDQEFDLKQKKRRKKKRASHAGPRRL